MKIKVIGSGNIWSKEHSSSFIIDDKIVMDMPNGNCGELKKMGYKIGDLKTIILTHFHADHYLDMPFYLLEQSLSSNKEPINIYCGKGGKKKIKKLFKLSFPNDMKDLKELKPNYIDEDSFEIEQYKVMRILVEHGNMKPSYGYIFDDGDRKVGFSGDAKLNSNIEYMAKKCDYFFCDCSLENGSENHMGVNNIVYLASKYPKCIFYPTHMSSSVRNILSSILKYDNIIVLEDKMRINI